MAKKSMSVTLEEATINRLKYLAEEEMRSISNLIDYIVAQYEKSLNTSVASKINRADAFGKRIQITNHSEINSALLKNVDIDDDDKAFLTQMGEYDI